MAIKEWKIHKAKITQNVIKIVLCDDDCIFLTSLQKILQNIFSKMNIVAEINSFNAPSKIDDEILKSCDMIFLDIDFEKENLNGVDIAKQLRKINKDALLFFVTNFIEYAPEGYEVNAFRYILKRDISEILERYILQAIEQFVDEKEKLRLFDDDMCVDLVIKHIKYIEVLDHLVSIHEKERTYNLNTTLTSLETELEKYGFLRIHNSYLINMAMIRKFRSRECILLDGTILPVSEKKYAIQKQKYLSWKGIQL